MGRRLAPLIAVGVVILVALIAGVSGPVQVREPIIPFDPSDAEPTALPTLATEEADEDEEVPTNPVTVGIALYIVAVIVAGLIVAVRWLSWLASWFGSRSRAARGPDVQSPNITVATLRDAAELAVYEAEAAGPGEASDAVVACWVLLEQAAASAGTPRHAPQTPTEFTAAVLDEYRADRPAVETLLGLYHQARFSERPLPDEAVSTAARALRAISASLSSAARPRERS